MPVKELVGLYELHASNSVSRDEKNDRRSSRSDRNSGERAADARLRTPSPRRFVPHPLLQNANLRSYVPNSPVNGLQNTTSSSTLVSGGNDPTDTASEFTDIMTSTTSTTLHDDISVHQAPQDETSRHVPDALDATETKLKSHQPLLRHKSNFAQEEELEMNELIPKPSRLDHHPTAESILKRPIRVSWNSSNASLERVPQLFAHQPVPAAAIFSRTAASLSFPELDDALAAIPAPSFPAYSKINPTQPGKTPPMFPPMQLLAASGKTLEDLETNTQVPHWWQSRNKISGALVSLALSITVRAGRNENVQLHT